MEDTETVKPPPAGRRVEPLVGPFCELAFDHQPGDTCQTCGLEVDKYGNTEADFRNCCFPDCGCDGERLCMAQTGANDNSRECNVEGMYQRTDRVAKEAKMTLLILCSES